MKKNLYLMRHGKTLFNERNLFQGVVNSPLTEEGKAQARRTRSEYFEKKKIDCPLVYTSPEGRAVQTTEIVTDRPWQWVRDLHEMDFGKLEGCPVDLFPSPEEFADYFVPLGGESAQTVKTRMNRALQSVMDQAEDENVLVVSHGQAIECFYQCWEENSPVKKDCGLANCCVLHYEYDPEEKRFSLVDLYNPIEGSTEKALFMATR